METLQDSQRLSHVGVAQPKQAPEAMAQISSLVLLKTHSAWMLPDERVAGEVELLLDTNTLLVATLVFANHDGTWHLDDSDLLQEAHVDRHYSVTLGRRSATPATLKINTADIVVITISNPSETSYQYALVRNGIPGLNLVHEGFVAGRGTAGPPDDSMLAIHNLGPGEYVLTFYPDSGFLWHSSELEIRLNP